FSSAPKTIIENVTVSSDFIQNLFFDEINQSNLKLLEIDDARTSENGLKCILQLRELAKTFPSYQAIQFVDAWGKFPSGIISGHLTDLGNYDQCIKTSVVLIPSHGITNGQYCFASFPLLSPANMNSDQSNASSTAKDLKIVSDAVQMSITMRLGVCIPDTCSPELVNKILKKAMSNVLNGRLSSATLSNCSVARKPDFRAIDIIAIVLYSSIGAMMLLSSLYDFGTAYWNIKPKPLLLSFSVISNGKKLFMINQEKSPNSITCLTGIRVFSMFWVIHCHNYLYYSQLNVINIASALNWVNNFWSLGILMGTVSVDSFFFLSGLLVAWLGLKELDKTNGKINIALMYIHRYIRLTPALAAVVLFYITINRYIGSGPFRVPSEGCAESWWYTLLYIQNYVKSPFGCVAQAWYLACDTQLYVLSPLVLIPLWKWGRKFIPAIVILALLSIGCIIGTFFVQGYTSVLGFGKPLGTLPKTYIKTHTRYSVWLIGIMFGFFMHTNRNKTFKLSTVVQLIGWIVSLGVMVTIIFMPYFIADFPYDSSVLLAASNESFKRVFWVLALAWIVFVCHFGYGGLVNSILSHPFWQPLGRLTYCMYLVHMAVQEINFGISRTDVYFSDYFMFLQFWSTFGITLLSAIVLSLSFEAPILVIEKAIFGKRNTKSDSCDNLVSSSSQSKASC
ncbi:nose resistant to fluoxetine protein 6-like, partial [Eupeodes corollae]|uniref:nose resistant to fluoxetine protein 6-like n=1 Tax=Eupeodes corollae TaxID=290404 RepID=UPI0024919DCD